VRVLVIIPTRHEAPAIGRVLADFPRNVINEVIVVDRNQRNVAGNRA
jgi:glycosyltransferase involved in cell wall biosynthesis